MATCSASAPRHRRLGAWPLRRRCACLLLALLTLGACEPTPPRVFDQQLYIWQRQWRPAHGEALAQSRAAFSTLRVLALQAHPRAGWSHARIDPHQLIEDGRPLVAVVRLDGQLPQLDTEAIRLQVRQLLADWQAVGLRPKGLEIDHDCASARLPAYAELLRTLRQDLPAELQLSITALPAWLASPALESVLAAVDSSVLQVHGVTDPTRGLFEPQQAERWTRAYAERSPSPFYLALPAYGVALIDTPQGTPLVESEASLNTAAPRRELQTDPRQVAALLQTLQGDAPTNLTGLIWFRLPLAGDRRVWPLSTLLAVAQGKPLSATLAVESQRTGDLTELSLRNGGNLAGPLPSRIDIPATQCEAADAVGGYRVQRIPAGLRFQRLDAGQLPVGRQLALGWVRCHTLDQGAIHVEP
ncbi:MAG: DUF3142 domain-containing protein [Pseudomonadota bacterium]